MLIEGECGDGGPAQAAAKFGFCRQRYFQLRAAFMQKGALGLRSQKRGPKTHYRRTEELVCQVIRHRFLDGDASTEVIAQKLRQCGFAISKRSVDRVMAQFGLQKNSTNIVQTASALASSPSAPAKQTEVKKPIRSASNVKSANYSLRKSPAT